MSRMLSEHYHFSLMPVHDTSVPYPQHTPNQHMPTVAYSETTTAETAYIIIRHIIQNINT